MMDQSDQRDPLAAQPPEAVSGSVAPNLVEQTYNFQEILGLLRYERISDRIADSAILKMKADGSQIWIGRSPRRITQLQKF